MAAATKRLKEAPKPLETYGFRPYTNVAGVNFSDQLLYDRLAFARRTSVDQGAPIRRQLFKRIAERLLPGHFEWHDWTNDVVEVLCNNGLVALPGCSQSAKTFNVCSFAVVWWLADPDISSVTLVSTSRQSLRRRGWAEITKCHTEIPGPRIGNFIDSRMVWQNKKGDDKGAIIGRAVEEGSVQKVADDIKGVHTRRQMVIIDEATSVPEAIFEACANLYSYPEEFILVLIGNPLNRLDQFGRFCEPKNGWTSVTVDSHEWEGKPQDRVGGRIPRIVRFDAERSPNIRKGMVVSKHLPTKEEVERARNAGGGQTPYYWQNFRGFWPPEGLVKTVFSESVLRANDAYGKHRFTGRNFMVIGAFDPAFGGGDRAALRFAKIGEVVGGKWGIECMPPMLIPINATSKNPVHFQLAEQVMRQCSKVMAGGVEMSCAPENFALDATGEGGGLADILQRMWSHRIIRVEFGGRASEDAVNLEDNRPACEVYENKAVEMWFRARDAVNAGQLKGIDVETSTELCNRMFDDTGKRMKLQKKVDYKEMFKRSPDLADSMVILLEVARRRGFMLAAVGQTVNRASAWDADAVKASEVYKENAMYQEEEPVQQSEWEDEPEEMTI